jgi:hypothetical protein
MSNPFQRPTLCLSSLNLQPSFLNIQIQSTSNNKKFKFIHTQHNSLSLSRLQNIKRNDRSRARPFATRKNKVPTLLIKDQFFF